MSAIFGVLRFDGDPVSPRDLERMGNALAYRGPDGRKTMVDGAVGLGHCLMRVNREDLFEAQPLRDPDANLTIVADLRLDNREELATLLGISDAVLRELPDSALVLQAYKACGEQCVDRLLGDFAFAIWDGNAGKLFLGRDAMGQRYVHYHKGEKFFAFGTDIKAIWHYPDVPRTLSEEQIGRMLLRDRGPAAWGTPFEGIQGLTGGTAMSVDGTGAITERRYWEPRPDPAHLGHDEAYYIAAYRRILGEAVACRLRRTIRPPGLIFSGGYDSAAIAGLAGSVLGASGRKLVAAASVMPADYRGTIRHARAWVELCARDMPHLDVRYVTREGRTVLSGLEQAFADSELPVGPYHFVTDDLLSALASGGARLVMDGHGGDYTLNPRGQTTLAHFLATFQLRRFVAEVIGHMRMTRRSLWTTLRRDVVPPLLPSGLRTLARRMRQTKPIGHSPPIDDAFARKLVAKSARADVPLHMPLSPPKSMRGARRRMASILECKAAGPAPGIAIQAARQGLELTRPFHDKRVVELGLAVPEELYVKAGRNRYLACAALEDLYPAEFQTRSRQNDDEIPDFQSMATSIADQIRADIERMERSDHLPRYVDFTKIRRLLAARGPDDHNSGWEQETQLALHGYLIARYVEQFARLNR